MKELVQTAGKRGAHAGRGREGARTLDCSGLHQGSARPGDHHDADTQTGQEYAGRRHAQAPVKPHFAGRVVWLPSGAHLWELDDLGRRGNGSRSSRWLRRGASQVRCTTAPSLDDEERGPGAGRRRHAALCYLPVGPTHSASGGFHRAAKQAEGLSTSPRRGSENLTVNTVHRL